MTGTISTRLAKLEATFAPEAGRSFTITGGREDQVDAFLAGFGVQRTQWDDVMHIADDQDAMVRETPGAQMTLTRCSDMGMVLAYVAKYGKSLLDEGKEAA